MISIAIGQQVVGDATVWQRRDARQNEVGIVQCCRLQAELCMSHCKKIENDEQQHWNQIM